MKQKGFTLIELLAVIAILAVILSIAIPSISSMINSVKLQAFDESEQTMIKAAKSFIVVNRSYLPLNVGDTKEVKLSDLQQEKYLEVIKSPEDRNTTCNGYVLITKTNKDKYDYAPHLNCANNIGSLTDDKLVGHWKFDDFQEPTTNLLFDNGISNWTVSNLGTTVTRTTVVENYKYKITSGASSGTFRFYIPLSKLTNGQTYNLSYKYKINTGTSFNMSDWNDTTVSNRVDKDYDKYSYSSGCGTLATYTSTYRFMDFNISANTEVEIWDVQLEQKGYATSFTDNSRNGTVKDYSGNGNSATLQLTTTPQWVEGGKVGNGAYGFYNTSKYILTDTTISLTGSQTFVAWVNPTTTSTLRGIVSLHDHTTTSNIGLNLISGKLSASIGYTDGTREYNQKLSTSNISVNEWTHVVLVYDQPLNKILFYINGEFDSQYSLTKTVKFTTGKLVIGQWSVPYLGNYFISGLIDDVKLYGRALNAAEIKQSYR